MLYFVILFFCTLNNQLIFTLGYLAYFERSTSFRSSQSRNAIRDEHFKWPNGEIPYVFSEEYSLEDKEKVWNAFTTFHEKTCINFIPKVKDTSHIKFTKSKFYCSSTIGYRNQTKPIEVSLSKYCLKHRGAMQHELLHVLGLVHEQCRPDRDKYIKIFWDNIIENYKSDFLKVPAAYFDTFNLPYDYNSLLHYPRNAFAKNNNFTMVAKNSTNLVLGQIDGPTDLDLKKVNKMYKC